MTDALQRTLAANYPAIRAVSTAHREGWEHYGRRMAQTWLTNAAAIPLAFHPEGYDLTDDDGQPLGPGLIEREPLGTIGWLQQFKQSHPYRERGPYNFRLDAARFAHKVAALCTEALREDAPQFLIWVDADVVVHSPLQAEFVVDQLLPQGDQFVAMLDRVTMYPESGFMVFAMRHPEATSFFQTLRRFYTLGGVFDLDEWHDAFVIDELLRRMGLPRRSLSGKMGRATTHPLVNGPLGAYFDHLKGARKGEGHSRRSDLRVKRTEPYWQRIQGAKP